MPTKGVRTYVMTCDMVEAHATGLSKLFKIDTKDA